jgi:4-hydroxy-2-oxoheptanedioate aldolase
MRKSKTLAKIRAGEPVRICTLGHFIPPYVHLAAQAGYDCIWLDLEHKLIDEREVQALLAQFHLADIDCMLRPPTREKARLYRYLEDGATGLMIPHVSTVEQAEELVQAVKFPPMGDRGLDGVGFDTYYTITERDEYTEFANRETFLVVQIETPTAVDNVEAIAALDGIAGLFVGPGDLGLRLSKYQGLPSLSECIAQVAQAAELYGKAWGLPAGTPEQLEKYRGMGAQLLAHGSEFRALKAMLDAGSRRFDEMVEKTSHVSE